MYPPRKGLFNQISFFSISNDSEIHEANNSIAYPKNGIKIVSAEAIIATTITIRIPAINFSILKNPYNQTRGIKHKITCTSILASCISPILNFHSL